MALWSCPHCGASQSATARCWVCHRSSTTCSTCRHFRASLAADLGYCGLDPKRRPLTGLELRGCWTDGVAGRDQGAPTAPGDGPSRQTPSRSRTGPDDAAWIARHAGRDFVPVDDIEAQAVRLDQGSEPDAVPLIARDAIEPWDVRTSLFGELEG